MTRASGEDGPLRRVWFPLRSNVPCPGPAGAGLGVEARAKLLALLAGELLFEPGVLDVTVTEAGASSCWIPPGSVDEEGYRRRCLAGMRVGEPVVVAWTPEGDEVTSPLVGAHVLEYHTLLRRSGLEGAPWVRWSAPEPLVARAEESARREEHAGTAPPRSRALPRVEESPSADEQAAAGLESDVSFAALIGATAAVDYSRRTLLRLGPTGDPLRAGQPSGAATIRHFMTPNLTRLGWPDVIALHDDDAVAALRAELAEPRSESDDRVSDDTLVERIGSAGEGLIEVALFAVAAHGRDLFAPTGGGATALTLRA